MTGTVEIYIYIYINAACISRYDRKSKAKLFEKKKIQSWLEELFDLVSKIRS